MPNFFDIINAASGRAVPPPPGAVQQIAPAPAALPPAALPLPTPAAMPPTASPLPADAAPGAVQPGSVQPGAVPAVAAGTTDNIAGQRFGLGGPNMMPPTNTMRPMMPVGGPMRRLPITAPGMAAAPGPGARMTAQPAIDPQNIMRMRAMGVA